MVDPALVRAAFRFGSEVLNLISLFVAQRGGSNPAPAETDLDEPVDFSPATCACRPASFDYCVEPVAAALAELGASGASLCYEFRYDLVVVLFGGFCFALGRLTAPTPLRRPDVRRGPAAHRPGRAPH